MPPAYPGLQVSPLSETEAAEVYRFLSRNPLRTFSLMGMMLRNGLTGPQNRGTFYGCRDQLGTLRLGGASFDFPSLPITPGVLPVP